MESSLAIQAHEHSDEKKSPSFKDSLGLLEYLNTPELVIGLCGPIGAPINEVHDACTELLEKLDYKVVPIKLSDFIVEYFPKLKNRNHEYPDDYLSTDNTAFELKKRKIEIGNILRKEFHNTFLAECAVKKIAELRPNTEEGEKSEVETMQEAVKGKRFAYIINSIKNQGELDLLRGIYRNLFYVIGITTTISNRINYLDKKMSKSEIWQLIDEETGEEIQHGQTVKNTFPQSDFFINISSNKLDKKEEIDNKVFRFFSLIFSNRILTPTIPETAMYHAASAAWNSACLSRQVGACLTDSEGEILSVGWNDVPIYGGGLYQSNQRRDNERDPSFLNKNYTDERCYRSETCFNDLEKNKMSDMIINSLSDQKLLNEEVNDYIGKSTMIVRKSKINSLVEFSRSIHAEMHAIITGCISSGNRIHNGKLFITTYPCHMCARHIVMAGIKEVYYIEPYKKSLTTQLHGDSITDDGDVLISDSHKVHIKQFEGVGPNRYMHFFKMIPESRKEKLTGRMLKSKVDEKEMSPKNTISLTAIPTIESAITKELLKKVGQ